MFSFFAKTLIKRKSGDFIYCAEKNLAARNWNDSVINFNIAHSVVGDPIFPPDHFLRRSSKPTCLST